MTTMTAATPITARHTKDPSRRPKGLLRSSRSCSKMWLPVIIALCAGTMVSLSEIPNKIWAGETRSDTLFARVQGKPFVEHNMLGYFPIELLVRYLEQVEREAELKGKYVQMERQSQEAAFSQLVKEYRSILKQLSSVISVDRYPVPYKRENVTKKPEEVNLAVSEAETDTDWITKTTMNPNLPQHSAERVTPPHLQYTQQNEYDLQTSVPVQQTYINSEEEYSDTGGAVLPRYTLKVTTSVHSHMQSAMNSFAYTYDLQQGTLPNSKAPFYPNKPPSAASDRHQTHYDLGNPVPLPHS
ncbi:hypothetical protein AAMO2058_001647900 [Amorphochlora amoebiformis]